jgi:hypothetical protein
MSQTEAIVDAVGRICDRFDDAYWLGVRHGAPVP